ncbi:MAG: hypothetical protein ACHQFW_06960 [Chitinophagales bacterium]
MVPKFLLLLLLSSSFLVGYCQDSSFIKVHFLYGSKPAPKYKDVEHKWFGGKLGGHVGIEGSDDEILNFLPNGGVHIFEKSGDIQSRFAVYSEMGFYRIFPSSDDSIKKTIVIIPVSGEQKAIFNSITEIYLADSPYDYAFFGMRCGAAAYDILSRLGIVEPLSHSANWRKIFYPKKLRMQLLETADEKGWQVIEAPGSSKRKWERD